MGSCSALIKAIDAYIAKADDDLADILDKAGFAEPDGTVDEISALEEKTAEILEAQTAIFDKKLKKLKNSVEITAMVEEFEAEDSTADKISEIYHEEFNEIIPKLSNVYLKKMDNELVIEKIRDRTSAWIDDFSAKLGSWIGEHLMNSIKPVLFYGVQSGESIAEITARIYDKNYHEHYYQARRIAITEMLRAHSVAQQEAIIQNPAVDYKEWRHTGSHKNNPRENHVGMDGVKALKDEPFNLLGADGKSHTPMLPRDSELTASESVNCHCIHRGIVNENVLGLSLEERKRLQDEAVMADDSLWKAELDAKNRDKSLTNPENSGIMVSGGDMLDKLNEIEQRLNTFDNLNNRNVAQYLENMGRITIANKLEGVPGAGRQGDAIVNGLKTEFKTLDKGAVPSTIKNTVNKSISGKGQARRIVIDARNTSLTKDEAEQGIFKALGISRGKVDYIEIIGNDYFFGYAPKTDNNIEG